MMEDFIMKPVYPAARALPTYENLLLEMVEPNILKVTLNRPKAYNALSHDLVRELTELSQWLVDDQFIFSTFKSAFALPFVTSMVNR